jgi:mannose-6-phosphate isomerase-like protein (cupin superfamily)
MRMVLSAIFLPVCLAVAQALASSEILHDNEHIRALTVTLQPQQTAAPDSGRDRVLVYLDRGRLKETTSSGKSEIVEVKPGDVRWAPAAEQLVAENVAPQPLEFVEIQLKGKKQPPVALTDMDPIQRDPRHWSLVLDNDKVRIARVRFGPLENGVEHQHVRNYLVVYVNDQAKGKRGMVTLHLGEGTTTHSEGNPLNHAVERIAVELK